jgi:hypothetical protein
MMAVVRPLGDVLSFSVAPFGRVSDGRYQQSRSKMVVAAPLGLSAISLSTGEAPWLQRLRGRHEAAPAGHI